MNKKTVIASLLAFALILNITALEAYAFNCGKTKGRAWSLERTFFRKAHLILINQEELGLSDKQVKEIRDLKTKAKKDLIRKNAEIDIIALDISRAMWEEPVDTGAINKLIDKKYDLKKENAKSLVEAYAALKGVLKDEQKDKLKTLWEKCTKKWMQKSGMKAR